VADLAVRSGLAGVDAERVVRWIFPRSVLESADRPFAADVAHTLAAVVRS
jgi:hypothetical protein